MSTFDYTTEFQRSIIGHMFGSKDFLRKVHGAIKPEHFTGKIDSTYAEIMLDFYTKFPNDQINMSVVMESIRNLQAKKRIQEEEIDTYLQAFLEIMKPPTSPGFIEQEIGDFITARSLENSFAQAIDLMKKGKYNQAADLVTNTHVMTKKKETVDDRRLVSGSEDFFKKLDDPNFFGGKHGMPTGINDLDDRLFHRGVAAGELLLFVGPTGCGKSPALMNCAAYQAMMGHDVLFYTLELSSDINEMRVNSCWSGIPVNDMAMNGNAVRERITALRGKKKFGELIVIDLPANVLKPSHVRRDIRMYRELGYNLKSVFVDYQQLMKSDKVITDKRLEYSDVCVELRSVAKDEKIAGFSAVQGNRGSLNKMDVDLDSVAEDYSTAWTADYVVGISQTKKEKDFAHVSGMGSGGKIRLFIAKNRNEKKGDNIPLWPDFSRMRFSMIDWSRIDHEVYGLPLIA